MNVALGRKVSQAKAERAPTDAATMAKLNQYALISLEPKQVAVYELAVCNTLVDRDQESFSSELVSDFCATLPGKSLLIAHAYPEPGLGRFIDARVEMVEGVETLIGTCYLLRDDPEAAVVIQRMDGGVVAYCSIGFYAPAVEDVVDQRTGQLVGRTYVRGPDGQAGETLEVSLVFLGAQYGAEVLAAKRPKSACCPSCRTKSARCDGEMAVLEAELAGLDQLLAELREPAGVFGSKAPRPAGDLIELGARRQRLVEELSR